MRIHEFLKSFGKSRSWAFRAWQFVILFLRSITLLAFAWVGLQVKRGYDTWSISECIPSGLVEQALTIFAIAEVIDSLVPLICATQKSGWDCSARVLDCSYFLKHNFTHAP